jgi:ribosomal protein S6--L-glutamate ligase
VVRQFEMMRVYTVNESVAIARSRDKLRSMQLLSRKGIGLPVTIFAHRTSNPQEVIELAGGAPVVIKLLEGHAGDRRGAGRDAQGGRVDHPGVRRRRHQHPGPGIYQGSARRGHPLHRDRRQGGREHEAARAGRGFPIEPPPRRLGPVGQDHAAGARNGDRRGQGDGPERVRRRYAALQSRPGGDGSELSPGLEGIEQATGVDVAGKIIEFIEGHAKPGKTKTKGTG